MITLRFLFLLCALVVHCFAHAQYTLALRCSEMNSYIDKSFHVRVTETASGREVGRKTISSIQFDTLDIELIVLLNGQNYQVDFYVDLNENNSYDPPPNDHSWRRMVLNAAGDSEINFTPFVDYVNINYPEEIEYGYYSATWGGKWMNQTFGTTDSIEASIEIGCDSLFLSFTAAGVFGNPASVSFAFVQARQAEFDPVTDTIHFAIDTPWTGQVYSINGELHGNLFLGDIGLELEGTVGRQQILSQYTVTNNGSPFANGYFYLKELDVTFNFLPLEITFHESPITCHGGHDGSLELGVLGGTGNYEYSWWETGTNSPFVYGLWADTFTVVVSDEFCDIQASYILNDPPPFYIDNIEVTNASCPGACDGVITITASGGVPPYSFTGQGEFCTGQYTVFVTDALGCQATEDVFIGTESNLEIVNLDILSATNGHPNGSAEVEVEGGIPPYSYSIDGVQYQPTSIFDGLPPGPYCITILDDLGCYIKTDTFLIENITNVTGITPNFKIYPNPVTTILNVESNVPVSLDLIDLNGRILNQLPISILHEVSIAEYPHGVYIVRLSDIAGNTYRKQVFH